MNSLTTILMAVLILAVACTTPDAPASTEPIAPTEAKPPTLITSGKPIFISAPNKPGITVQSHNDGYEDVYKLVGGDGSHQVSQQRWQQVMDILGWGMTPIDEARNNRWREQWDHWDNIDAFTDEMAKISADGTIYKDEMTVLCANLSKWKNEMRAARDYVNEYRRIDPDTVAKNGGLAKL